MALLVIPVFLFVGFFIMGIVSAITSGNRSQAKQYYEDNYRLSMKGTTTTNIDTAKSCLASMEAGYAMVKDFTPSVSRNCYESDIEDVRENIRLLEVEQWQNKADKILEHFEELYLLITDEIDFTDVDKAYRAKKKCLSYWDKYWDSIHECEATVYPKQYLKDFLSSDYDPCMEHKATLEAKLDEHILKMRPEYKRKMGIYDAIIEYIAEKSSAQRSILLKHPFPNSIPKEVECCYKELKKSGRIIEVKMGGLYFASLSDKEVKKRQKAADKKAASLAKKGSTTASQGEE